MTRFARACLYLYPPSIRREYGSEMAATMASAWRDRRGVRARALLALDLLRDVVSSWRHVRRAGSSRPSAMRRPRPASSVGADALAALRLFSRSPLFAAGAVLTLALGVGASAAIVSLADATLLRPLAIARPDRVLETDFEWSYPDFHELERADTPFTKVAAFSDERLGFDHAGGSTEIEADLVSGGYFALTDVRPVAGRLLTPDDDRAGAPPVVVLSERAWTRLTGREPAIVGSIVSLNRTPVTVVGIAPASFRGLSLRSAPDAFLPIHAYSVVGTGVFSRPQVLTGRIVWLTVVGRLRDGATPAQAAAAIWAIQRRLHPPPPGEPPHPTTLGAVADRALADAGVDDPRRFVYLLLAATAVTLLLACATVANLMLVRSERRRRELAVRAALGASRARLIRLIAVECAAIGVAGSLGALAVARTVFTLLSSFTLPGAIAIADLDLHVSPSVFGVALALGLATALAFGIVPAWRGSRLDTSAALADGGRGAARRPIRGRLVAAQVAFCVVLLLGSIAFGRALRHALTADLGFDTRDTVLVTVNPAQARYSPARMSEVEARVIGALRAQPWVSNAGWMSVAPLRGLMFWEIGIPGVTAPGASVSTENNAVSAGYFDAMGIPLLEGRAFDDADAAGTPFVAIVNEAMARTYWHGRALGAHVAMNPRAGRDATLATVVGVVGDMRRSVDRPSSPTIYLALAQQPSELSSAQTLVVRGRMPQDAALGAALGVLKRIEPGLPIVSPQTMAEHLGARLMPQRMGLTLFLAFAALASVLTALGIYAVAAFAVASRWREIGIRVALGADRARVIGLVIRQGLVPVGAGAVIGGAAFLAAGSAMQRFLFGLPVLTAASAAMVAAAVALLAIAAILAPARRALAVDPTAALRVE